ncbi:PilN domain-containing protein [Patescibacteria group bacterium]|nr:PilN domain-containing protein [Patescibacteria group bacterium]
MIYKNKSNINLLNNIEAPKGTFDILYSWFFKFGRHIVVAVGLVVIIAFIFKFIADQQYNSAIGKEKHLQSILNSSQMQKKITEITSYQSKMLSISQVNTLTYHPATILSDILNLIPAGIVVSSVSFNVNNISISGTAVSYSDLQSLSNNFVNDSKIFNNVLIPQLTNSALESSSNINYSLTANIVKKK